ncbi:MAG: DNA translocase FtsK, partial [Planctomycetota bacterium]
NESVVGSADAAVLGDIIDEESDWDDDDESDIDEVESISRDLMLDEEPVRLRQDTPTETDSDATVSINAPHIKLPKRREAQRELDAAVQENAAGDVSDYVLPSLELLEGSDGFDYEEQHAEALQKSVLLQKTIESFGYKVQVTNVEIGPVIAQYEIELEAGLRLNKISALADDLAIALRVPSVRVVAPIPGKNTVGIEVPNEIRQVVRLRDVIEETSGDQLAKFNIPVFLGKDVSGEPMPVDLAKMPHLLIAGRTGTGKSVCLNAIITSILMTCRPDEVRMLMIDPKMVELSGYGRLPHLMHPVITDMKKAEAILGWAVEKMEERYSLLAKVGVRHINSFNDLGRDEVLHRLEVDESDGPTDVPDKLPFIVIVADEMADLMMTAGKDVEQHIIRLAQKSRAVGIHLILATQKPTVDVITGLIKSNLPARLSFQVASKTDSRVVLDENGADKLLGNGDMLFLWPGTSTLIRGQGTYLSDAEIDRVCDHCSDGLAQDFVGELMNLKVDEEAGEAGDLNVDQLRKKDDLYESAIEVVVREGRGSLSLIQRCLGIGYGRAARLIDYMAEDGIVGQYNGSKSREVLITMAQWQAMQGLETELVDDEADSDLESVSTTSSQVHYAGVDDDEEYEDVD